MPSDEELTRQNPQFSPGERLASIEAQLKTLASGDDLASLRAEMYGHWRLDQSTEASAREEVEALRRELSAQVAATEKAISKAEEAQRRQSELTRQQSDRREEIANQRLLALERGESAGRGEKEGVRGVRGDTVAILSVLVAVAAAIILAFH